MKTEMNKNGEGLQSYGEGDRIALTSKRKVNRAARGKTQDPCSHLLVEDFHIVRDGEESAQRDI